VSASRIAFDDLPEGLRERLGPRVERLGYLGEFFQVGAHQPDALTGFHQFTEALKAALPSRLVEIIALTVATRTGNAYERVQHERLALTLGFPLDEVRAIVERGSEAPGLDPLERAVADLASEVCSAQGRACLSYDEVEVLADDAVAVGCLMMASRYLAHATMSNTWGLEPPVASPLAEAGHV
jgi:alkylhydroperoxidase family enzyme